MTKIRAACVLPTLFLATVALAQYVDVTAPGSGPYVCRVDGEQVSTHTSEYKASAQSVNLKLANPDAAVVCEQKRSLVATLTAAGKALIADAGASVIIGPNESTAIYLINEDFAVTPLANDQNPYFDDGTAFVKLPMPTTASDAWSYTWTEGDVAGNGLDSLRMFFVDENGDPAPQSEIQVDFDFATSANFDDVRTTGVDGIHLMSIASDLDGLYGSNTLIYIEPDADGNWWVDVNKSDEPSTWEEVRQSANEPTYDGSVYHVRLHVKLNSAVGVSDGVIEAWVDDTKIIDRNDIEIFIYPDQLMYRMGLSPYILDGINDATGPVTVHVDNLRVLGLAGGEPAPANNAPVWTTQPAPVFVEGVASSYDLDALVTDADGDPLVFTNETGCTLPTGVSIDSPNDELDATTGTSAGTTENCVFGVEDGVTGVVLSNSFPIVVSSSSTWIRDEYEGLTQYFVDAATGDDDDNDGLSEAEAFATPYGCMDNQTAGSICLIKNGTYTIDHYSADGSSSGRPKLHHTNNGTEANPIVVANYPGHTNVIFSNSGGGAMAGCRARSYITYDGIDFDGNGSSTRLIAIHEGSTHCTIRHSKLHDAEWTGGSNVGLIYLHGGSSADTPDYHVIEYNDFYDARTTDGNIDQAGILTYFSADTIWRYNIFRDMEVQWYRSKSPSNNSQGVAWYSDFYRNYIYNVVDSRYDGATQSTTHYDYGRFRENLLVGVGPFGMSSASDDADPPYINKFKTWLFYNNTIIDGPVFRNGAGNGPAIDVIDLQVYNNISARTDSGDQVQTTESSDWPLDYDYRFYLFDYNGYSLPDISNWNQHTRYPIANHNYATWQSRATGNSNGFDANSIRTTDPKFVDASSGDYRLASDSPFKGAGKDDGTSGGAAIDMGAFGVEYWYPNVGPSPQ